MTEGGNAASVERGPESVVVNVDGPVSTIEFRRSGRRNAVDRSLARTLSSAIDIASARPDCTCIVLRGLDGTFCAGWDLADIASATSQGPGGVAELLRCGRSLLDALDACPVGVVAAVDGHALGFGLTMLCHVDAAVVRAGSRLALPELDAGVVPASAMGDLAAVVGARRATVWSLLGEVDPSEALAAGLIHSLVPAEGFQAALDAVTSRIGGLDRTAVARTRAVGRELAALPWSERAPAGDRAALALLSDGGGTHGS